MPAPGIGSDRATQRRNLLWAHLAHSRVSRATVSFLISERSLGPGRGNHRSSCLAADLDVTR
jgi:hypothetical protein